MAKVVILATDLSGLGGTETVFKIVLKYMPESVLTITTPMADSKWLDGIDSSRIKQLGKNNKYFRIIKLICYLFSLDNEVLLINKPSRIYYAYLVRKIFKKKYKIVSWIHFSLDASSSLNVTQIKYLEMADRHLAISSKIRDQLLELNVKNEDINLIYNPVELGNKIIMPSNCNVNKIIYVGRVQFEGQKNLSLLFRSLAYLDIDTWVLDVYGSGTEKDIQDCKHLIKELGLDNNIVWHGWTTKPWNEIEECDFLVLSSNYEGFAMILLEAMSRGIPCISTDCLTGPRDIIDDRNGILVQMGDPKAFSDAMRKIINGEVIFDRNNIVESIKKFSVDNYIKKMRTDLEF